jgi:carboxyl-terminal processing protease
MSRRHDAMPPEAEAYLTGALDLVERHAVNRERIDWPALRAEAVAAAAGARAPAETYPAIEQALKRLGDRHSFLRRPEELARARGGARHGLGFTAAYPEGIVTLVFPDSPAGRAGVRERDAIEALNGLPLAAHDEARFDAAIDGPRAELALRRPDGERLVAAIEAAAYPTDLFPDGRLLGDVGYLELPIHLGRGEDAVEGAAAGEAYAAAAHRTVRELDPRATGGWIVDLRRNRGGDMWPMIVAAGPLIGEGDCCGFASSLGSQRIAYRDGASWLDGGSYDATGFVPGVPQARVAEPYRPATPTRVAVLTSRYTGSSGEFVALCFRGRPGARSFGTPTAGVPTGNMTVPLSDGAMIMLTVCLGADRTGRTYDGPLAPDEAVEPAWTAFGTDRDPVIAAALAWLRRAAHEGRTRRRAETCRA